MTLKQRLEKLEATQRPRSREVVLLVERGGQRYRQTGEPITADEMAGLQDTHEFIVLRGVEGSAGPGGIVIERSYGVPGSTGRTLSPGIHTHRPAAMAGFLSFLSCIPRVSIQQSLPLKAACKSIDSKCTIYKRYVCPMGHWWDTEGQKMAVIHSKAKQAFHRI